MTNSDYIVHIIKGAQWDPYIVLFPDNQSPAPTMAMGNELTLTSDRYLNSLSGIPVYPRASRTSPSTDL